MRIAFLSYLHGFGGAEKQNIMLANAMATRGHDVTLISICADNNCYTLDSRVKYIFLPDRKDNIFRLITRYQDIKRELKEIKPDLTVSFWFQSAYLAALMKKSITGKNIYSERGDPGDKEYNGTLGMIRKLTLPRIDGFVFQSKGAQSYFNNKVQRHSIVIPNPVFLKLEDYPIVTERRKVIVTVGRLHPQKNQELLISAFAKIAEQIPEYTLEIYGDGELKETLQTKVDSLSVTSRVFLKGTSKKIHRLMYDTSLFVLSSDYEGIPNTLLEAMALGLPCISTDCKPGGARELIDDRINGRIVARQSVDDLAEAILEVLNNKKEAKEYGEKAKEKAKEFSPEKIYDKWERYLKEIISQH